MSIEPGVVQPIAAADDDTPAPGAVPRRRLSPAAHALHPAPGLRRPDRPLGAGLANRLDQLDCASGAVRGLRRLPRSGRDRHALAAPPGEPGSAHRRLDARHPARHRRWPRHRPLLGAPGRPVAGRLGPLPGAEDCAPAALHRLVRHRRGLESGDHPLRRLLPDGDRHLWRGRQCRPQPDPHGPVLRARAGRRSSERSSSRVLSRRSFRAFASPSRSPSCSWSPPR